MSLMEIDRTLGQRQARRDAETMVREAHHRVTNHLTILASLMGLKAREHESEAVREALMDARRKVLAVARLQADLQDAGGGAFIDIARYLNRLREDLRLCFSDGEDVDLRLDFDIDSGETPAETAVTLGLIVNELVSNSIKHAVLPRGGAVRVSLRRREQGWLLVVRDDGPGPPDNAFETDGAHGLSMVALLVRRLHGRASVERMTDGARAVCVQFA